MAVGAPCRCGHDPGRLADQVRRQIGDGRGPLRGEAGQVNGQLIKAFRPLGPKWLGVALFTDQDVQPGQKQSGIGARLDWQPDGRTARR